MTTTSTAILSLPGNTPMLLEHCIDDTMIGVDSGRQPRDQLQGWGASVTWTEYDKGGHWFNYPRGMDGVREFVLDALGVDAPRIARLVRKSGVGLVHAGGWVGSNAPLIHIYMLVAKHT